MKRTESITFYSDGGGSVTLGCAHSSQIWLDDAQGIDGLQSSINTAAGVDQIGDTIVSARLGARPMTLLGKIRSAVDANRSALLSAFNPLFGGMIVYEDTSYSPTKVRSLPVRIEKAPEFSRSMYPDFQIDLIAPYPLWIDGDGTERESETFTAGAAQVENTGDTEAGYTLTIDLTAPASSITLADAETYAELSILYSFEAGDKVVITSGYDNNTATLTRSGVTMNLFPYVTGDWFQLARGINSLTLIGATGTASIEYDIAYVGARR